MRSLFAVVSHRKDNTQAALTSPVEKDTGFVHEEATVKPRVLPTNSEVVLSTGDALAVKQKTREQIIAQRQRVEQKAIMRRERLKQKTIARLELLKKEPCPKDNPIVLNSMDFSDYNFGPVSLQHVSMKDTILVGAEMEQCTHLSPQQVAGANLHHATLPKTLEEAFDNGFDLLTELNKKIGLAEGGLFVVLLLMIVVAFTTGDAELITNRGAAPLPILNLPLPPLFFAILSPAIALGFFVWTHCHIQKYWRGIEKMPSVFPDGTPLTSKGVPWLATGWLERYYPCLVGQYKEPHSVVFAGSFLFFLYWMTPLAITAMAWRDLSLHNWVLAYWHIFLITASCVLAVVFHEMMVDTFRVHAQLRPKRKLRWFTSVLKFLTRLPHLPRFFRPALWGLVCFALCKAWASNDIEGWKSFPRNFPSENCNFQMPREARLSNEKLSKQPDGWFLPNPLVYTPPSNQVKPGAEQQRRAKIENDNGVRRQKLMQVQGAILNNRDLNNAIADGAFLVNAKMRFTQLEKAYLVGAQMQGADLSGANLSDANLSEANMQDAMLSEPDNEWPTVAELKGANLSRCNLRYAHLSSVSLRGADLWKTQFQGAVMVDVDLSNIKADLAYNKPAYVHQGEDTTPTRIIFNNSADFEGANLQRAFLMYSDFAGSNWSNTDLSESCLIGCSLDSHNFDESTNVDKAIICMGEPGDTDGKHSPNATRIPFTGIDTNGNQTSNGCLYVTYGMGRRVYELVPITPQQAANDPNLWAWKKEIEFLTNRSLDSLLPSLRRLRFIGVGESENVLKNIRGGYKPLQGMFPAPVSVDARGPYHRQF